jgi:hydroxymethylpyrimidine pyrophosphatase-like HAD family hydrolase
MKINTIVNDVDGCISKNIHTDGLSFDEKTIGDIEMYKEFTEQNPDLEFILCTGRALYQIKGIINRVPRIEWVITEGGTIIENIKTGEKIDLGKDCPARKSLLKLLKYSKTFAKAEQFPKKTNMISIDVKGEANPVYFNRYIQSIPLDLKRECISRGINFGWDPTAINITLPITKKTGLSRLFSLLSERDKLSYEEFVKRTAYIGDSTSDIEGMEVCYFAATMTNDDEKNKRVREYLKEKRKNTSFISQYSNAFGNKDCLEKIKEIEHAS